MVQLHDINAINFTTVHQLVRSKGATIFALNTQEETSLTGETTKLVYLAVAVKRKLQLYYLKNQAFFQLMDDINLTDIPKSMVWCEKSICVGYRGEYALIEVYYLVFSFQNFSVSFACYFKECYGIESKVFLISYVGYNDYDCQTKIIDS